MLLGYSPFCRNCTLTQRVNYFDSKKYCKVLIQQDVSNARKTGTKSNCFELHWKLFWSVCKLPRIFSIELKYPGFLHFILYNFYEIIILICEFTISEGKNFDETLRFTYTYMQIILHSQEINTRKIKQMSIK